MRHSSTSGSVLSLDTLDTRNRRVSVSTFASTSIGSFITPTIASYPSTLPGTPPPAYFSHSTPPTSPTISCCLRDPVEATVQDTGDILFDRDRADETTKMTLDEIYSLVVQVGTRHSLDMCQMTEAQEKVRAEWAQRVGARLKRKKLAWYAGAAIVLATMIGIGFGIARAA